MSKSNSTKLSPLAKDEAGNTYGRLTVIAFAFVKSQVHWLCKCECGNTTTVAGSDLRRGTTTSCGCGRRGAGGHSGSPIYRVWHAMKQRCYNPNSCNYKHYGRRGITVCVRWRESFLNFLEDMGPRPFPEASIDRIDNKGNYEPDNCRWADPLTQSQNTRKARLITFNGETLCLRAWARKIGIQHHTLAMRLKRGWPLEKALTTPSLQPKHNPSSL